MKGLIVYEFKKLWNKTSITAIVSLLIISTFITFTFFLNPDLATFKSNGEIVKGISSFRALNKETKDLEGKINDKYLESLLDKYEKSEEKKLGNDSGYFQKYEEVNIFLNFAKYGEKINNFAIDLDKEFFTSADKYYRENKEKIKELIKINNENRRSKIYTNKQMEVIEEKIDKLKDSFTTGYTLGTATFIEQFGNQYWLIFIVLAFALSSIFSTDSDNGIEELMLASKLGRQKSLNARIISGNLFAIGVYCLFVLIMLIEIGGIATLNGWTLSAQNYWHTCIYNITIGEGILLMIFMGGIGVLVVANLVMMMSILIKRVKIITLVNIGIIIFLVEMTKTLDQIKLELNPIFFVGRLSITNISDFEIYHFMGNILIPYSLIVIILAIIYLIIIRIISVIGYKRYRLC